MERVKNDLQAAIADYLAAMAEVEQRFGSDSCPEDHSAIGSELRARMRRARAKVTASIDDPPEVHAAHLRAFTKGMRIVLRRLGPADQYRPPRAVGVCGRCCNVVHMGSYVEVGGKVFHDACAPHYSKWRK